VLLTLKPFVENPMDKKCFLLFILLIELHYPLLGQTTSHLIRGQVTELNSKYPVSFADISTRNNKLISKTNNQGEFQLFLNEFPTAIKVSKFGFKVATVIVNSPDDSIVISLVPYEIHKRKLTNKTQLEYELILKKAIEKFEIYEGSETPDPIQKKLLYCKIISSVDNSINSLYESYMLMNVNKYILREQQTKIGRYASIKDYIPGLSENKLEFKIDPFISLPMFIKQYIYRSGYFVQDDNQIALVGIDLGEIKNVYYINVADTSIIHITSQFSSNLKNPIPESHSASNSNRSSTIEISFSRSIENKDQYLIDYIIENEVFRLIQKNNLDQIISKSTLYSIVSDSSQIYDAVRDYSLHETLTESKQQINFNAKFLLSRKSTEFNSETENLARKPYMHDFWILNSYITPDFKERRQIQNWENDNGFYSENLLSSSNEIIGVDSLVKVMNNSIVAVENVYVETDRSDYVAGDSIWFSAFVLENLHMDSTSLSKILYVDLINSDNKLESHLKLLIKNGRSRGNFAINKDAKVGIYRLRAYTQYMRNFQSEYLFEKDIPVHQSNLKNLIIVNPIIKKSINGDSVELHIKTILPDEYKVQGKHLDVFVRLNDTLSVRKTFNFKQDLNNSMGFFVPSSLACSFADINFTLSDWTVISTQRISLPLKSGINLQFFPESGKMVDKIKTIIAYKATDTRGNPTKFNADIIDENQNKVVHIDSDESGVGKFEFTPQCNQNYKALLNLSGNNYIFNLPGTEPKGYVLNFNADSSDILIKNNLNDFKRKHYLLVSVRGVVYASIETKLDNKTLPIHLPLEMYPKGIVQITLFDSLFRPLAERLVFNNRSDKKMLVHIVTDKKDYGQREKVNLTIKVTDAGGSPVVASLSMSVVDVAKNDSILNSVNIEPYLYLTSEIKGKVDYVLFNLIDTTKTGKRKIDMVMMTQGWRNFLWNSIRYTKTMKSLYPIEKAFYVDGSVYDYNKRTLETDYRLDYFDLKMGLNGSVKIGNDSRFKIEIPIFYGSHVLFIQNRNRREKISKLGFILDTVAVPEISYRNNELQYVSYRTSSGRALIKQSPEIKAENGPYKKYISIPEVTITAKSDHTGYSAPTKMIDLEKKDPTGKKYSNLFQMIYKEFGEKAFTATGYEAKGKPYSPILVVNGEPMTASECPPCYDFAAYEWAATIPVNEVSDVKFYEAGSKYSQWITPSPAPPTMGNVKWKTDATGRMALYMLPWDRKIYLPVVTLKTRSKSYRGNPKGAILFPYQGIYIAREFYQPDYENKIIQSPDNRTTIYWNPEIQTDSSGIAKVSFYNSDMKGKALIRISGVSYQLKDASSTISQYLSH
jgi:hypothetical protein